MATTEEQLVGVLEAAAGVTQWLDAPPNTRLNPLVLPQKPTLPAATYTRIGGAPVNSFDGLDGLDNGVYQIDCYAETAVVARTLADAIRDALDASAALGGTLLDVRTDYEEDPRLYRVSMDWSLWAAES